MINNISIILAPGLLRLETRSLLPNKMLKMDRERFLHSCQTKLWNRQKATLFAELWTWAVQGLIYKMAEKSELAAIALSCSAALLARVMEILSAKI